MDTGKPPDDGLDCAGDEPPDKPPDETQLLCATCNLTCTSRLQLQQHLAGAKHAKAVRSAARRRAASSTAASLPAASPPALAPPPLRCTLCNILCTSQLQLQEHMRGSKHALRAAAAARAAAGELAAFDPLVCHVCSVRCTSALQLEEHRAGRMHAARLAAAGGAGSCATAAMPAAAPSAPPAASLSKAGSCCSSASSSSSSSSSGSEGDGEGSAAPFVLRLTSEAAAAAAMAATAEAAAAPAAAATRELLLQLPCAAGAAIPRHAGRAFLSLLREQLPQPHVRITGDIMALGCRRLRLSKRAVYDIVGVWRRTLAARNAAATADAVRARLSHLRLCKADELVAALTSTALSHGSSLGIAARAFAKACHGHDCGVDLLKVAARLSSCRGDQHSSVAVDGEEEGEEEEREREEEEEEENEQALLSELPPRLSLAAQQLRQLSQHDIACLTAVAGAVQAVDIHTPLTGARVARAGRAGESALVRLLTEQLGRSAFWTEKQLRDMGSAVTPDILFKRPVRLRAGGRLLHWLDSKNAWLIPSVSPPASLRSFHAQVRRYEETLGAGAVVWHRGYFQSLADEGSPTLTHLVLDSSAAGKRRSTGAAAGYGGGAAVAEAGAAAAKLL